jgi:putative iron-dependent peroxidase
MNSNWSPLMTVCQSAVMQVVPMVGRYLSFSLATSDVAQIRQSLKRLSSFADTSNMLVGLGAELVQAVGAQVPGLKIFEPLSGPSVKVASTPIALLCWLRGSDMGHLVLQTRLVKQALNPALQLEKVVDAFRHGQGPNGHGLDLTGYEDGIENPKGAAAVEAALVQNAGPGLDGGSFMAVQQWLHDLNAFEVMTPLAQDHMIGRRRFDSEELDEAPESAHVKRTAQESFEPEAFVLRRSMPWAAGEQAGLMFVAFGKSFAAFETQLRRMLGLDDAVVDALFGMSKPISTAYFWCPPVSGGRLDLRQLGL